MRDAILEIIGNCTLSAKGIADRLKIDPTSGALRYIETVCWDMQAKSELIAVDTREQLRGVLFFRANITNQ